jgi:hypothetical protein
MEETPPARGTSTVNVELDAPGMQEEPQTFVGE